VNDIATAAPTEEPLGGTAPLTESVDLLDAHLPTYDVVVTEHLVVEADPDRVFEAVRSFDFMTTRSPFITAAMTARALSGRLLGHGPEAPTTLMLARDQGALPGWLVLAEAPGREVVFGAVGTFWTADIEWHDLTADQFASFSAPGWGKIACHLLVRPDGPGRSILTYECRTATTDPRSRSQMARYWWLIRPFVAYLLRAVLRTIRENVDARA
jgi:hypothetical protein